MNARVDQAVLDILKDATVNQAEYTIRLNTEKLERSLYEDVNEVLTRIGGKWKGGKIKAHVYQYNPASLLETVLSSGLMPPKNPFAFFETPKDLIHDMFFLYGLDDIQDLIGYAARDVRILEPSAGLGAIATRINQYIKYYETHSSSPYKRLLDCVEIDPFRAEVLRSKGLTVYEQDFLTFEPDYRYDAIYMNPPFSVEGNKTCYIDHIKYAFSLLAYQTGFLVAIAHPSFTYRQDKKSKAFKEFVETYGSYELLEGGLFKESGTSIPVVVVYLRHTDLNYSQ